MDCMEDRNFRVEFPRFIHQNRPHALMATEIDWSLERVTVSIPVTRETLSAKCGDGEPRLSAIKWHAVEQVEKKMLDYGLEPVEVRTEFTDKPPTLHIRIAHMPRAELRTDLHR